MGSTPTLAPRSDTRHAVDAIWSPALPAVCCTANTPRTVSDHRMSSEAAMDTNCA